MRWLTTLLLAALVAAAGYWYLKGDDLAPGLRPAGATSSSTAAPILREQLVANSLKQIELTRNGETLTLTKTASGWTQPGNWPVRQAVAEELAAALTNLVPRFEPIALVGETPDMTPYGLSEKQNPTTIKLDSEGKTVTLLVGQPDPKADEPLFARPTYLRIDKQPEVVRFAADLADVVTRPAQSYRRRQLFPDTDRADLTGGEPAPNPLQPAPPTAATGRITIINDTVTSIEATGPQGGYRLKRIAPTPAPTKKPDQPGEASLSAEQLASVWELEQTATAGSALKPLRDRLDPAKFRGIATAVPELWVEQFISGKTADETGLAKPERTVRVGLADGRTTVLKIGKESRRISKVEEIPPPMFGQPPPPAPMKVEVFHFAQIDGLPLVFEVRADKFPDLFPTLDTLRDANIARFDPATVSAVSVNRPGQTPIVLTRKKGNKFAEKPADQQDRWYLGDTLAETSTVTELLDQLAKLEARGDGAIVDPADAKAAEALGFDGKNGTLSITTPARTITLNLGKIDAEKKLRAVQLAGWPRVNQLAIDSLKLVERSALAYRGRRLFDTAEAKPTKLAVSVKGEKAPLAYTLQQDAAAADAWKLTQPIALAADETKVNQLVGDLSQLEAIEFLDDAPTPENLDKKYGLKTPKLTLALALKGGKEQTLDVGNSPEFKPEYYARLNGAGSVFSIPKPIVDQLEQGATALLPLQQWSFAPDAITGFEIARGPAATIEKYQLQADGKAWKLSGPFDASIPSAATQPLVSATATVSAVRYEALSATPNLMSFGLDQPSAKLQVRVKAATPPVVPGAPPAAPMVTTKSLLLGKPTTDMPPGRYAMLEDGPKLVFVVPETLFAEIDRPALEFLDTQLLNIDGNTVQRLALVGTSAESNVTLAKSEKTGWKAEGQSFTVDAPTVDRLVQTLARLPVAKIAAYGANVKWAEFGLEQPERTLSIDCTPTDASGALVLKPESHTVRLGKASPDGGRYARIDNGPAVAIIDARALPTLIKSKLDFVDRSVLSFDPTVLTGITRTQDKAELILTQNDSGQWGLTKPTTAKADTVLMDDLAEQLSRLRFSSVSAFGSKDEKPFGLDKPAAVISLKIGLEKPDEKRVKIGNPVDPAKPTGDRFAVLEGKAEPTVGVLPAVLANKLLAEPLKFRDRTLATFADADRAVLVRGDRKVTFAKIAGSWKMVEPLAADAEQGDLEELINALAKLRADELEADKPTDLKPFGLDKPEAKWTLRAGDQEVLSLLIGAKEKTGPRVYAKLEKGDLVAKLDAKLTERVLGEYRTRAVWTGVDASQIETLAISSGDGKSNFALRKMGMQWIDPAKATEPINAAKVSEFLATLAGLKAERYVVDQKADLKLYGLEPPERIIVLNQKGGTVQTLHLGLAEGGSGGKRIYARVDAPGRTDVFILSDADTAKLRQDRAAFVGK